MLSRPRQAKVDLSGNDNNQASSSGGGASFSSFSQERAVVFDRRESVGDGGLTRGQGVGVLLEWSNLIILGISVASALAFITGQREIGKVNSGYVMGMQSAHQINNPGRLIELLPPAADSFDICFRLLHDPQQSHDWLLQYFINKITFGGKVSASI